MIRCIFCMWLLIGCVVGMGPEGYAQTFYTERKSAIKHYYKAKDAIRLRYFSRAIQHLHKALRRDRTFVEAHLMLAHVYGGLLEEENITKHLEAALAIDTSYAKNIPVQRLLGQRYLEAGRYQEAQRILTYYLSHSAPGERHARALLARATFACEQMARPHQVRPMPLAAPLNDFALQYFPSLTLDGNTLAFTVRQGMTPLHDEDLYISYRDSTGQWSSPVFLSADINTEVNEGAATLSPDGRSLVFTSCQRADKMGSCDLYVSHVENGKWSPPALMPAPINTPYWESQPSLSADGRALYFVSSRPGGYGKRDIWVSKLRGDSIWEAPQNLGAGINSAEDDVSPYVHPNGELLYFSSDGHRGLGGFDLFLSEREAAGTWGAAQNMGYPLNDWNDQVSLVVSYDGREGYYTYEVRKSIQYTSDLYRFTLPATLQVKKKASLLRGYVRDSVSGHGLEASLSLFVRGRAENTYTVRSHPGTGSYEIAIPEGRDYLLYARRKGYLLASHTLSHIQGGVIQQLDIALQPIEKGMRFEFEHIFFDVDAYTLDKRSRTEIKEVARFLRTQPALRVAIEGHTDDTGTPEHNTWLSRRRAQTVYQALVDDGVSAEQMRFQGYGSTNPRAPNDTPAHKALNRRIEFRIQ